MAGFGVGVLLLVAGGGGFPNNMTVSPDNTLLTRAIPTGGNCNPTTGSTLGVVVDVVDVVVDGVVEAIFIEAIMVAALVVDMFLFFSSNVTFFSSVGMVGVYDYIL
jgi:hypothetical protein